MVLGDKYVKENNIVEALDVPEIAGDISKWLIFDYIYDLNNQAQAPYDLLLVSLVVGALASTAGLAVKKV